MEEENNEVLYKIKPRFNILYELLMPTGRKIQQTIVMLLIFIVITIFLQFADININVSSNNIFMGFNIMELLNIICIISIIFLSIKLIVHIIFQTLQYNNMSYSFYNNHMVYEDDFLNQHKKTIHYTNIKEIEIRRTIFDRILGYGIIVVYTNAENEANNGLVIYSIKDPKYHYEKIDKIVHSNTNDFIKNNNPILNVEKKDIIEKTAEESFDESLKNINK